jgi:hypothetical protein
MQDWPAYRFSYIILWYFSAIPMLSRVRFLTSVFVFGQHIFLERRAHRLSPVAIVFIIEPVPEQRKFKGASAIVILFQRRCGGIVRKHQFEHFPFKSHHGDEGVARPVKQPADQLRFPVA